MYRRSVTAQHQQRKPAKLNSHRFLPDTARHTDRFRVQRGLAGAASAQKEWACVPHALCWNNSRQVTLLLFSIHAYLSSLTLHHAEGPWDDVMRVIGQAHSLLHENGVVRIQSDIRVGSRTDKKQTAEDKVAAVKAILDKDEQA